MQVLMLTTEKAKLITAMVKAAYGVAPRRWGQKHVRMTNALSAILEEYDVTPKT